MIINNQLNIEPKAGILEHQSTGSDYYPFSLRGIPFIWFFTGLHPDYHTPADETNTIDLDKVTEITKITYLGLRHLSNEEY